MSLWDFIFGSDNDDIIMNAEQEQLAEDDSTEGDPHNLEAERGDDGGQDSVIPDYASESETKHKPSNGAFWRSIFGLN